MWSSRIIPSTPYRGNTSQAIRCLPTTTVIHVGVAGQSGAGRSIHEERVTFQSLLRQSPYLFYRPPPCRRVTRVGIFPPSPEKDFKREVWHGNKVGLWVERDDMLSERLVSSVWTLAPPGTDSTNVDPSTRRWSFKFSRLWVICCYYSVGFMCRGDIFTNLNISRQCLCELDVGF